MALTIGFDVYGTIIDTQGVMEQLESIVGDQAAVFSKTWREKQLEYSFRRGLMQQYVSFDICTSQALEYTCCALQLSLSETEKTRLLESYKTLPAFADVHDGLTQLKQSGAALYAFSNGKKDAVEQLLAHAAIDTLFNDIISCDEVQSFKPNPAVYNHFLHRTKAGKNNAWLVSSNPFDVTGAVSAGMKAAWVKRNTAAVFDPWEIQPTATIDQLSKLINVT